MQMNRIGKFAAWLLSAGLLAFAVGPAKADPVKIRIGWIAAPGELIAIMFDPPGVAKHRGVTYEWEPIHFQASPNQITSLAAGELDIAALGFSSVTLAIQNAGLKDLRIFADEFQNGAQGYFSTRYSVLKDSPIQTVEDLKGKVVATNGIGAGVHILMVGGLVKHGLQDKRDYTTIEVAFPNMRSVLTEHKADLITNTLPFAMTPEMQAATRTLFTANEGFGASDLSFWTARQGFLEKNHAAVVDLLEDYVRTIRWYMDPANHDAAVKIVANFFKLPPDSFQSWLFTKNDWYRNLDASPDLDVLQSNIDLTAKLGFLKSTMDIKPYADLSLVKEAAARVK
jgi:NitT/TauT family transport system substrate-binding protein